MIRDDLAPREHIVFMPNNYLLRPAFCVSLSDLHIPPSVSALNTTCLPPSYRLPPFDCCLSPKTVPTALRISKFQNRDIKANTTTVVGDPCRVLAAAYYLPHPTHWLQLPASRLSGIFSSICAASFDTKSKIELNKMKSLFPALL
mmetsp:Transcript_10427/g.21891  ORF Transcript_10427/g.21891 Transcript_10427/m.21891 type:complete len:145 (-) Transcript_10427:169-603(-)